MAIKKAQLIIAMNTGNNMDGKQMFKNSQHESLGKKTDATKQAIVKLS
jgi:hypothetical protein